MLKVALAGNPNCGKTALFNAFTGSRQKVGNYPGVTVERKEGHVTTPSGEVITLLDLPGTYSLNAKTPDEMITRDVLLGKVASESLPDVVIAVVDAANLERCLGLVLELKVLQIPLVLAVNMMDLAFQRGMELDVSVLQKELGIPVFPTVAVKSEGLLPLLKELESLTTSVDSKSTTSERTVNWKESSLDEVRERFRQVDEILNRAVKKKASPTVWTDRIDRIVLHPFWGFLTLLSLLFVMFQAIFIFAKIPAEWIQAAVAWIGKGISLGLGDGPFTSLLVDGALAGVGGILVFLPQILILFLFILLLEDSGYMARAAFLMDRLMGRVGLHGRAFIPLLSSYACAIPGIMATRTIENRRDRLTTILVAPLTTCSARLPVYTLLIAAFIPAISVGPIGVQGLTMFALYIAGIVATLMMAMIFRKTIFPGKKPELLMELPTYKWPSLKSVAYGLFERAKIFVRRAGTVILSLSVALWFLASYPKPPSNAVEPAIHYSYAGKIGRAIEPIFKPIGFNWKISIALIPGFAAREVMVSSLATVYAIEAADAAGEDKTQDALALILRKDWSTATALSLLIWYVLASQCLSTLAVVRRETNSWRWPAFLLFYSTSLAYASSFIVYRVALHFGLGG